MRIAYNNLLDNATLTESSEIAGMPVENVKNNRLSVKWMSDSSTSQTVVVDLGSAQTCKVWAIIGHNINSGATVKAQGNATNSWTSPTVDETITYNSGIMLKFATGGSFRYWRFSFSGLTTSLQIGRLWLGDYIDVSPSSLTSFSVEYKNDDIVEYGRGRQKFYTMGNTWRSFNLSFPKTGNTMISSIISMLNSVGKSKNVIFCNFDTMRGYELVEPCYCSIQDDVTFNHVSGLGFSYSLKLEEDL